MATVNFQCGNCNKLMAVGAEHLGQQVRCPHCQAVVVAPAANGAPAPAPAAPQPTPFSPTVSEQDDIFAPPEPSDELFGGNDAPRVEMPPPVAPQPPTIALDASANPAAAAPAGVTLTYPGQAPEPAPAPAGDATLPSWMSPEASASVPSPFGGDGATQTAAEPGHIDALPTMVRKPRDGGGWFIGLVFIPLISYAVLVSILAGYLFLLRVQKDAPPPSPLETLPSFDPNDAEHSTHLKSDPRAHLRIDSKIVWRPTGIDVATATGPLPDDLVTPLGKKLRVGDLEVEPLRVTRETVSVHTDGFQKSEPCQRPSLVLYMKLRNVSDNVVFQPLDRYFYRKWEKKSEQPPLTLVQLLGSSKPTNIFGGPARYPPPSRSAAEGNNPQEWVDGNDYERVLQPGEEMNAFVCTDGDDRKAVDAIDNHHGKLMWRVHLRRGIVVRDEHHYVPVSSVVGVEFTDEDYRKSS